MLLLGWGTVDQVRYYLALHSDDLRDPQRAAPSIHSIVAVQLRLARKELDDGQPQQAEVALRRATQANPADPAPRQALLKLLIEQKRFDEALTVTETALKHSPKDANLLVDLRNSGTSSWTRRRRPRDWDRALLIDPQQWLPHCTWRRSSIVRGKPRRGSVYYVVFLERSSPQKQDKNGPPQNW